MWFSAILLAAVVMAATAAIPGHGAYFEESSWRDILSSDPAFAKMAAEYGATFQKTSVETTTCGDKCVVDFGEERHLLYLNEEVADPEDPCLIYTCTANEVNTRNVKSSCPQVDVCRNGGRPVRQPNQCCAQCIGPSGPDDEFTEWGDWTECSRTCGIGFTARRRECKIVNGRRVDCKGNKTEVKECPEPPAVPRPCPVNCTWEWSQWSSCSASCGTGEKTRTIIILKEAENGGFCPEIETQSMECTGTDKGTVCIQPDGTAVCDNDGDCILPPKDNCVNISNPDQLNSDQPKRDSFGDLCDNCVGHYNEDQTDTDGDGTGDACDEDIDNDGKYNQYDNCKFTYNPNQRNRDKKHDDPNNQLGDCCDPCTLINGVCYTIETLSGTKDSDGDGYEDNCDSCPNISNKNQYDRPCDKNSPATLNNDKKGLAAELIERLMEMYYSN